MMKVHEIDYLLSKTADKERKRAFEEDTDLERRLDRVFNTSNLSERTVLQWIGLFAVVGLGFAWLAFGWMFPLVFNEGVIGITTTHETIKTLIFALGVAWWILVPYNYYKWMRTTK